MVRLVCLRYPKKFDCQWVGLVQQTDGESMVVGAQWAVLLSVRQIAQVQQRGYSWRALVLVWVQISATVGVQSFKQHANLTKKTQ